MMAFDSNARLSEIEKNVADIKQSIIRLFALVKPENDLWDNSDILRNWHISERTLSGWRAKRKISYIQVGKKIFNT